MMERCGAEAAASRSASGWEGACGTLRPLQMTCQCRKCRRQGPSGLEGPLERHADHLSASRS